VVVGGVLVVVGVVPLASMVIFIVAATGFALFLLSRVRSECSSGHSSF
jgi:amino acid permease